MAASPLIEEGPLRDYHVSVLINVNGTDLVHAKLRSVSQTTTNTIDVSGFWDKKVHDPRIVALRSKIQIESPLQIVTEDNIIMGNKYAQTIEFSAEFKKKGVLSAYSVILDKMFLSWASIFKIIVTRQGDVEKRGTPNPPSAELGVVPAKNRSSGIEMVDARNSNANLFIRWKTVNSEIMYNAWVEVIDSRGVLWTFENTGEKESQWILRSAHIWLSMQDLTGPRFTANIKMVLTSTAGITVDLGVETDTVLNLENDLRSPARTLAVYNLSYQLELPYLYEPAAAAAVVLSNVVQPVAAPPVVRPWSIEISGTALIPAHAACHAAEVVLDKAKKVSVIFTQADAAAFVGWKKASAGVPFQLPARENYTVNVMKGQAPDTFRIISIFCRL
jgi:hypothetical protein